MRIIFELIKALEFEISLDGEKIKARVELFQNIEDPTHFRFNTFEADMFRLKPSFPRNEEGIAFIETDDILWTERTFPRVNNKEFFANDTNEAVEKILSIIKSLNNGL